jgi:crotonobetainyl-CoA:carnitine CoA-transferase CaiB-like acyl-CoA transferase
MPGPLDGVKILDLTMMVSGPQTTMILGDQGADVIKIENLATGDFSRLVTTARGGFAAAFLNNNRNKRSLTLNLKDQRGVDVLKDLAKNADVIIQNFRPGVMDRLGIGEEVIREVSPSIIYVSISGFGETGPYKDKPVYDPLIQAVSGLASIQGGSDDVRPRLVRTIVPDKLTGYATSQAICAALYSRTRTGEGQHIKISMLDTLIGFLWGSDMGGHTFVGDELETENAQSFIDLIYETQDGYISVAVQSDKEWKNLCAAFDKPEWLEDPRFLTAKLRTKNINHRLELTQKVLMTNTAGYWIEKLEGADVPCAPVLRRKDMIKHPQVLANDTLLYSEHHLAGSLRQARPAPRFSGTPTELRRGAPALGEHTAEVLKETGVSQEQLDALVEAGVVSIGKPHE